MGGSGSAPTERVLDIVELLSRAGGNQIRFSDVVRELNLAQGTAHSILTTLTARGWVTRDPVTKAFTLGPALAHVASGLRADRPMAQLARASVRRLADTMDMAASVLERAGDDLVITTFEHPADLTAVVSPLQRIPYAPPFGIAFAAWDSADEQEAWIRRGAGDAALQQRLRTVLTRTRERGYDIDWMTPALSQAAQAIGTLAGDAIPRTLRSVIDQLRVEFAAADPLPDDSTRGAHPVATISAPVLDAEGRIALVLAIHPLRAMTIREIRAAAKPLLREIEHVRSGGPVAVTEPRSR